MSYSLQRHGPQNAKPPYLSVSPGVCSNSCPFSQWCHPSTSFSATLFFFYFQSFPASASFPMSQLFTLGGQSIGASVSASVLPMNIQGWFSLGLTGLVSLQSNGFSRVFSSPTVQKQQFFSTQPSLWSNSHIPTWLLEKPQLWLYGHSYHAISQTYVVFAWEASSSSLSTSHHDEIPNGWPADFSFLSSPYSHGVPNPLLKVSMSRDDFSLFALLLAILFPGRFAFKLPWKPPAAPPPSSPHSSSFPESWLSSPLSLFSLCPQTSCHFNPNSKSDDTSCHFLNIFIFAFDCMPIVASVCQAPVTPLQLGYWNALPTGEF